MSLNSTKKFVFTKDFASSILNWTYFEVYFLIIMSRIFPKLKEKKFSVNKSSGYYVDPTYKIERKNQWHDNFSWNLSNQWFGNSQKNVPIKLKAPYNNIFENGYFQSEQNISNQLPTSHPFSDNLPLFPSFLYHYQRNDSFLTGCALYGGWT